MTRRGCGCCNCSPKRVEFDWNYYEAKDTRVYHKRNLSFVEEIEVFTRYYDPDTGRRTSSEESGVIATFQHDPIEQEFALTGSESDLLISCNVDIDTNRFIYHTINEWDDQGRLLVNKVYRGKLVVEGSHISKVAFESDLSDAHELGQENKHGHRTTSNIVISKYTTAPSVEATEAGLPKVQLQTKFSSDEAPDFSSERYNVQYWLQGFHSPTGASPDLTHEFSSLNSLDQMPEDMESFDQSFSDPLDASEDMGDAKWDEKRPTVQPGIAKLERQEDETLKTVYRRGYTLVEKEPNGPVIGKTYTLIQPGPKGSAARFAGDITSHYVNSYVTPEYDDTRKLQNEFAGKPDAIRDKPRKYASDPIALTEEPVQDIFLGTFDYYRGRSRKANWRSRGWSRLGYMSFESSKAYKDNVAIHLHELCFEDSFSRTERDVYLGDEEFRISVDLIDEVSGDVEFSQQFRKGYRSLDEDIDHEFFHKDGQNEFPVLSPVPGAYLTFRGHIDSDFDWLKRYPYRTSFEGEPEYRSKYYRFAHEGVYEKNILGGFLGTAAPLGIYQVDKDGTMSFLEGVPVSKGGLVSIERQKPSTYSYILKEHEGSEWNQVLMSSVNQPVPPSDLVSGIDYVDDIRMHVLETSGDFGDGMCQSFSHRPIGGGLGSDTLPSVIVPTWVNELARAVNDAGLFFEGTVARSFLGYTGGFTQPWLYSPYRKAGVDRALVDATTSPNNVNSRFTTLNAVGATGSYPLTTDSIDKMVEDGVVRVEILYESNQASQVSGSMSAPLTPTDASVMSFRVRDSHIEMGSFKQLSDGGFEDGVQFAYKPVRYGSEISGRESFAGFRLRFEIEGDDHFPGRIHTIGLADPDNNNREGCSLGECSMDPYSVLNYDIEVTGGDGLEHADITSGSYSSCRAYLSSIPSNDIGGVESHESHTNALTAYRPENAGDLNSHSFGDHISDFSYAFYGLINNSFSTPRGGYYLGFSYDDIRSLDAPDYRPWEWYDIKAANDYCSGTVEMYEFLTTPEATVDVSGGPCWYLPENHPDCYREHTVEYTSGGSFSVEAGQFANWNIESNFGDEEIPMTGPDCTEDDTFLAATEITIKPFGPNRDRYSTRARSRGTSISIDTQSHAYSSQVTESATLGTFGTDVYISVESYTKEVESSEGEVEEVEAKKLVVECWAHLPAFVGLGYSYSDADKVSEHLNPGFGQAAEELPRPQTVDVGYCHTAPGGGPCDQTSLDLFCRQLDSHTTVSFLSGSTEQCPNRPQTDPAGVVYGGYVDGRYYVTADQGTGEITLKCSGIGGIVGSDREFGPPVSVGDLVSREYTNAGDVVVAYRRLSYLSLQPYYLHQRRYLGAQEIELDDDFNPLDPPDLTLEFGEDMDIKFVSSITAQESITQITEAPACPQTEIQRSYAYYDSGPDNAPPDEEVQLYDDHIGYKETFSNWKPGYTPTVADFTGLTIKLKKRN